MRAFKSGNEGISYAALIPISPNSIVGKAYNDSGGAKLADEKVSLKMSEINGALSNYRLQGLEGVILNGDIEIEVDLGRNQG